MKSRMRTCLLASLGVTCWLAFAPVNAEAQVFRGRVVRGAISQYSGYGYQPRYYSGYGYQSSYYGNGYYGNGYYGNGYQPSYGYGYQSNYYGGYQPSYTSGYGPRYGNGYRSYPVYNNASRGGYYVY